MERGFDPTQESVPDSTPRLQWGAVIGAGLIAGLVLLIIPRGSPWSSLTFFEPSIMGRVVPATTGISMPVVWVIHLLLSLVYAAMIGTLIVRLRAERAVIAGGIISLVLYALNFAVVWLWFPALSGNEVAVFFTHVVFGLIAAGAYRGLLRRRAMAAPPR